ncbi:hypothetical protein [Actinacidiphila sp. bgisy144]|uniref:hypothetical protein n=1 Tax=Actinacidiphila sp. bgisy144 TaxID=3413791 RepID=UPI003EB85A12
MQLSIVVQNLGLGGLQDGDGNPQDRWPLLVDRINAAADRVDVVLLCEAASWGSAGHKQLARACRDLDLDAVPLTPARSGFGTALMYRREVLGRWTRWNPDFSEQALHGIAVTAFEIPGLPAPLSFVPVHFSPFAAEEAFIEANWAGTRGYKYGPFAVLGGDVNYPPASDDHPNPQYSAMRPYNLGSRTLLPPAGIQPDAIPVPDRRIARKLAHLGYVDVAWHLYERTKDLALLAPTGSDDRVDQAWVSGPLAGAVTGYRLLDTPPGASDHHGFVFQLDTAAIDTTDLWSYR